MGRPITVTGQEHDRLDVEVFNFDPTLAPAGKTPVKVLFEASYRHWKELAADGARYEEEKARIADTVIEQLDQRFPGLAAQVEVIDVATPLTIERYTGNWRGTQAWPAPGNLIGTLLRGVTRTLPGLAGFRMASQWSEGMASIPTGAVAGRNAIKALCKQDGVQFVPR